MTSETKTGLAIGLAFIIAFAVIISNGTGDKRYALPGPDIQLGAKPSSEPWLDDVTLPPPVREEEEVRTPEPITLVVPKPEEEVQPPVYGTYLVERGDTFSTIAQKILGTCKRWKELHSLNKKEFPRPEDLKAGAMIKIPLSLTKTERSRSESAWRDLTNKKGFLYRVIDSDPRLIPRSLRLATPKAMKKLEALDYPSPPYISGDRPE